MDYEFDIDDDKVAAIAQLVTEAEGYVEFLAVDRKEAREYYDGDSLPDLPSEAGRSKVVVRLVRAQSQKAMPSLIRTLVGTERMFEFQPETEEKAEQADQVSDYINGPVMEESDGWAAVYDAVHDGLNQRNGVLTAWYDEKKRAKISRHTGLTQQEMETLVSDGDSTIIERWNEEPAVMLDEQGQPVPIPLFGCRVKRIETDGRIRAHCIEPDEFLTLPGFQCLEDSPLNGWRQTVTRSDLVAMGYDKDKVDELPAKGTETLFQNEREQERGVFYQPYDSSILRETEEIDYYQLFVTLDNDEDGIVELYKLCFGGKITSDCLLAMEDWDVLPFVDVVTKRRPHRREGISLTDDLKDLQRVMSFFLRQTIDNLSWQNNPMMVYQEGSVENPDALMNPEFGRVIRVAQGVNAAEAAQFLQVPVVAKDSFGMLEWFKDEAEQRTGINDAASGLSPDALSGKTATATSIINQAGIGQIELIATTAAQGLKAFGRLLLHLTVKHQDKPRTYKLRGKYVTVDPRTWDANLHCNVNIGLGGGTRERDAMLMRGILDMQKEILATMGPENPLANLKHVSTALQRFAESAGVKTPEMFFNNPTPDEIAAYQEKVAQRPNPELEKAKAEHANQLALKDKDMEIKMHEAQIKAEGEKYREFVQSQAAVAEAESVAQIQEKGREADRELKREEMLMKTVLELVKLDHSADLGDSSAEAAQLNEKARMDLEEKRRAEDREYEMTREGITRGPDGKIKTKADQMMEALIAQMGRKKRVVTPDGEEFTMETVPDEPVMQ